MHPTDVRILDTTVAFHDVPLDHPLRLATATVDRFTLAVVTAVVEDRAGVIAEGVGASVLSVPWSWPRSDSPWEVRDTAMRDLTAAFATAATGRPHADPLAHATALHHPYPHGHGDPRGHGDPHGRADPHGPGDLHGRADPRRGGAVPALAVALARGGVDNAVHDAWARAAGRPAAELYTAKYLRDDLGLRLGPPRTHLPVQHVVGVGDPLEESGEVLSLHEWVRLEGIRHVKVKLSGRDPDEDAKRVAAVHRVLRQSAAETGDRGSARGGSLAGGPAASRGDKDFSLSLDPNEGYESAAGVVAMLEALRRDAPEAYAAVAYLEQPVPRDAPPDPEGMRALGRHKPVLADEGFADQHDLDDLVEHGWSGLVVKAAKGQSLALRAYAHARRNGLYVVVQDLTAVDHALAHSARLAATLDLDWPAFEYNSRQYAPAANRALAVHRPDLVAVRDGNIVVGPPQTGLY